MDEKSELNESVSSIGVTLEAADDDEDEDDEDDEGIEQ